MKVTYLYHSGFAIEDEQALYVFDYYKGELPVIAKEKQMYVFVSHRHKTTIILRFLIGRRNIRTSCTSCPMTWRQSRRLIGFL